MSPVEELRELEQLRLLCEDRSRDGDLVLNRAVAFAVNRTHSTLGFMSVVDFQDEQFLHSKERYVFSTIPEAWRVNLRFSLKIGGEKLKRRERSLSGLVAHTRKLYRCEDAKRDDYYLSVNDDVCSELVVPIEHDGKLLGVFNLESYQPYHYTSS